MKIFSSSLGKTKQDAVIIRSRDGLNINQDLVRQGYAVPRKASASQYDVNSDLILLDVLTRLKEQAKDSRIGLFQQCTSDLDSDVNIANGGNIFATDRAPQAEFEPIEWTIETKWGIDGGRPVRRRITVESDNGLIRVAPKSPGDVVGCSDFQFFEDSLKYYETYFPYYGDVAKLDRDGDGVPCPGLPHTNNQDRYRMKIPKRVANN